MADENKANAEANRALEANAKAASKSREEQLAAERKAADADTKAFYERTNNVQPTPTQEENDRAKLGFNSLEELDSKEDDGAPSEAEARIADAEAAVEREKTAAKK
jgi:hypothetical protein